MESFCCVWSPGVFKTQGTYHVLEQYKKLVLRNHDIFSADKIGYAAHYHHVIDPIEGAVTTQYRNQFPIPLADQPVLEEIAKTLLASNVLIAKPSMSNSSVFVVRKQGSDKLRIGQDFRAQNEVSLRTDTWVDPFSNVLEQWDFQNPRCLAV